MALCVKGLKGGPVSVVDRYLPAALAAASDEPQLPSACHPLIVLYMVARFEMHNDAQALNHVNVLLSLYERRKRRLRMDMDEPSHYAILNGY